MLPSCSIIIPAYNEEKYLPDLLTCIRNQTLQPKEVIVVDDQSTDKTPDIVKQFGYTLVKGDKKNPAGARNLGAQKATGEILLFLDADVTCPPLFLEDSLTEIDEKKLGIASCFAKPISSNNTDKLFHYATNLYINATRGFFLHGSGFCIFVAKKVHEQIGGFDEQLYLAEDHDYVQRAARLGKFGYLHGHKIHVSVRRFEEEGRWDIARKYVLSELYLFFKGKIKKPIFTYGFGKHDKSKADQEAQKL